MKLTFLGTGTSTGVPQLRCGCEVCTSADPRDRRMRASIIVTTDDGRNILIDCGPDMYHQLLREHSPELSAMLITHSHYDHVGGIDDLRPYCPGFPDNRFPVYCQEDVARDLRARVPYCFATHLYPGVPTFDLHIIRPMEAFRIATAGGIEVLPVPVMHYLLPILGFRIGDMAYITDCKTMPDETVEALRGIPVLVINALRPQPHMSHLSLPEALELIRRIAPGRAYLTHISHDMPRHASLTFLPENVFPAYDGLKIDIQ